MSQTIIHGANLRLARLFHGLTLEDVAAHIEKTRQYVHKIETEQITPPDATLKAIAQLTQVEPVFFLRQSTAFINEDQCHFRKQFSTRSAVKQVALAKGEMFRRLVVGLEEQLELPATSIPQIEASSLLEIEQAAEACRRHWSLGLGPVQNMTRVAENAGAVVTSFKGVSREVDAYSISAARPVIVVNSDDVSACRLRFDIAHELGHLVMHMGIATGDRKTEGEANRFAGAFLLPRSTFVKEFPKLRGMHLNWHGLSELKLRWKVSKAALLYRAKQLSLISEEQYKTGVIRLNRGGEARIEKEDSLILKEIPELFTQAIKLGFSQSRTSFESYCQKFSVKPDIIREFLVEYTPHFSPPPRTCSSENVNNVVALFERKRA